jgi:hypothetical protein
MGAKAFAGAGSLAAPEVTLLSLAVASSVGVIGGDTGASFVPGSAFAVVAFGAVSVAGADLSLAGGASAAEAVVCPATGSEKAINTRAIGIRKIMVGEAVWRFNMGSPSFYVSGRGNETVRVRPTNGTQKEPERSDGKSTSLLR